MAGPDDRQQPAHDAEVTLDIHDATIGQQATIHDHTEAGDAEAGP